MIMEIVLGLSVLTIMFDLFSFVVLMIIDGFYPINLATSRPIYMTLTLILVTSIFIAILSGLVVSGRD